MMTYAHRQDIFDADSHMMEPADWLARFAAPAVREALAPYLEGDNHAHERLAAAEQARGSGAEPTCQLPVPQDSMCKRSARPCSATW